MTTLAELRRARRREGEAQADISERHRSALGCYAITDPNCFCDCGHSRKSHAVDGPLVRGAFRLEAGECAFCSCTRFRPVDTFKCEYCGNDVRTCRDDDHCNDCALLEVERFRDLTP